MHDLRTAHDALCAHLDEIPKTHWRDQGVWGDDWTVSDLVAHLAEWQRLFLSWYEDGLEGITPQMPAPGYKWSELPRLNRAIREKHRSRSLADVIDDFETGYARILRIVDELTSTELLNPGALAWTGKHPLTTYLGANTASHYRFGLKVIRRWLRSVHALNSRAASRSMPAASEDGRREGPEKPGAHEGVASTAFRPATPEDWDAVDRLLRDCGLPIAGADEQLGGFLLATREGRLVGTAALERYGAAALLRSVAVAADARGTGLGGALVDAAIAHARDSGVETLVLLTETAPQFFPRFGFRPISRDEVPEGVLASEEFRGACCASAAVMRLDLVQVRGAPPA